MKSYILLLPLIVLSFFMSCSKDDEQSIAYWSELSSNKTKEIESLVASVSCTNINDFEILGAGINYTYYFAVHPSIKARFETLKDELNYYDKKVTETAMRQGIVLDYMASYPPIEKACENGKVKLTYAEDLSIEEVNNALVGRYDALINFYNDIPCTDASQWSVDYVQQLCNYEGFAIHKTIRTNEATLLVGAYNSLILRKRNLESTICLFESPVIKPTVGCKDGKPVIVNQ
ncbi:hypothetical protein [Sphingobacterium hungaricum]